MNEGELPPAAEKLFEALQQHTNWSRVGPDAVKSCLADPQRFGKMFTLFLCRGGQLEETRGLEGLLPICTACKKIRDEKGCWCQIESYIEARTKAEFTHSFCPDCMKRLYPELSS